MARKWYFKLAFRKPKRGEPDFTPEAQIELVHFAKASDGTITISRNCVNAKEMSSEIDRMISELKEIKTEAKLKYKNS
jgi:hypothetical protein